MIAIDIAQKPCQRAFMGANNLYAGYIAGKAVGQYFKKNFNCQYDTFLSLESSAAGAVNGQRMGGYRQGFTAICGKIHDLKTLDGADRIDPARAKVADALTALPDQKHIIVVSINDDGIEGALAAAKTAGRVNDLFVSGQGADPSAWCLIKNNKQWIADTAYSPGEVRDDRYPVSHQAGEGAVGSEDTVRTARDHQWGEYPEVLQAQELLEERSGDRSPVTRLQEA